MQATLITGKRQTEVVDVPEPEARPGAAVLEVGLCGICGSDVHAWEAGTAYPPFLCGHEWVGTVLELGDGATGVSVGERAVLGVPTACGTCGPCRAGHWHRCEGFFTLLAGARHGAYAPRIAVAAGALIPVLDGLSDEEAAQVEPATVALHAVRRRPPRLGEIVVVLGAGPIGLCVLQHARLAGAWRVIVAEPRERRRALALELGADVALAPGEELNEELARVTDGLGADVVYDCAGSASSTASAMDLARPAGTVMMVGISPEAISVRPSVWMAKELTVDSSLAHHHHEFGITMRLLADGRLRLAPMHARTIGLAGIAAALADLSDGSDDAKILVDPHRDAPA